MSAALQVLQYIANGIAAGVSAYEALRSTIAGEHPDAAAEIAELDARVFGALAGLDALQRSQRAEVDG